MLTEEQRSEVSVLQQGRGFLGREFLTWLWYMLETKKNRVSFKKLGHFEIFIDDRLVLSSKSGAVHESVLKGGTPGHAQEARTALLSGKLVQEARFVMQDETRQWQWVLKGEDLSLRGVKLPPVSDTEVGSFMTTRFLHLENLIDAVEELYTDFLKLRLNEKKNKDLEEELKDWFDSMEGPVH